MFISSKSIVDDLAADKSFDEEVIDDDDDDDKLRAQHKILDL